MQSIKPKTTVLKFHHCPNSLPSFNGIGSQTFKHENPQALATESHRRPWVHSSDPIAQHNTMQVLMDHAIRCQRDHNKRMLLIIHKSSPIRFCQIYRKCDTHLVLKITISIPLGYHAMASQSAVNAVIFFKQVCRACAARLAPNCEYHQLHIRRSYVFRGRSCGRFC